METLLRIGLSNTAAALALALAIVAVACIWRRPAVLHALWLLVLLKLVTPPVLWLPEPWLVTGADAAAKAVVDAPPMVSADMPLTVKWAPTDPPLKADPVEAPEPVLALVPDGDAVALSAPEEPAPVSPPAPVVVSTSVAPGWAATAFAVWLAGALAWYALAVHRLRRFHRLLRHAVPAPESLRQRTQRLAEKLRVRRCPTVWLIPGRVAPMLWAAGGRPRILFPVALLERIDVAQQNALLVHELAHLRRRDHWVRWLEFAAAGLYWWNPVLWFARRELREAEEQCCDAWVTSTLPDAGKTYATALLETLDFLSNAPHAAPLLASGVGRVSDLKRRLTMIMRGTTPRALSWRGLLGVLGLGALMLPLLPAWARAQAPAPAARPPVEAEVEKHGDFVIVNIGDDLRGLKTAVLTLEDANKTKAELRELEAQLAQKQAEVAALTAKVQEVRAKLAQGDGALKGRIVVQAAPDADYKKLQDLLQQIQKNQAGAEVIVLDQATGKILMKMQGGNPPPTMESVMKWVVKPLPPGGSVPPPMGNVPTAVPATPAPHDADKRIDELEQKLKTILEEVEKLRHERKPAAPEAGREEGLHSYGPEPLVKIPYVGRWFTTVGPAQAEQQKALAAQRDALQARLEELKASADEEARGNADEAQARAVVQATTAALQQAEARAAITEKSVKAGAARADELKEAQAEVAVRRAALEQAKAGLEQAAARQQDLEERTQAKLKAAAADRQAVEARLKQLEEELRKAKPAPPSKP